MSLCDESVSPSASCFLSLGHISEQEQTAVVASYGYREVAFTLSDPALWILVPIPRTTISFPG